MMFYKKRLLFPSLKQRYFAFDDFSGGMSNKLYGGISPKHAQICFNVSGGYGAFKQGLGFDKPSANVLNIASQIKQATCFEFAGQDMVAFVDEADNLVVSKIDDSSARQTLFKVNGKAKILPYKQNQKHTLLVFDDNGLSVWDGSITTTVKDVPIFEDVALYYERIFGIDKTDKTKLHFCQVLNPEVWGQGQDKGGYLTFDDSFGEIQKIISYWGYIYVFGRDKIARLKATDNQEYMQVIKIFTLNGRVFPETIKVCGDVIMFMAKDGIYKFDGSNMHKIATHLESFLQHSNTENACYFDRHYYLACKINFGDNKKICCENNGFANNVLLKVDVNSDKVEISRGVDVSHLVCLKDKLFFVSNGKFGEVSDSGMFFGISLPKVWETPYGDFGLMGKKVLNNLHIYTLTDLVLQIVADEKTHVFNLCGKNQVQKIKLGVVGDVFKIAFMSNSPKPLVVKPVFQIDYR